ncbi:unnamed protein product [Rotaria sordida]|uniref:PWWP domain-containing protein n=1 Tax=Rotaria sordida TaxID=392033 RepID=A0A816CUU9_9BILA|nr:unnamed protein product [Rotaria sordida]CAF1628944.1 unnamed protein product [Rotaria sordida]
MTNSSDKHKDQIKRKQVDDNILESSIFDILENDFQIGDIVWAKLNGLSWWPSFVYGCFSDNWRYVKPMSKPGLSTKKQYFVYCLGSHSQHAWVHQACLFRYKGLEEFLNYSETRAEQATTKPTEEQIRKRFSVKMPENLHSLWKQAIKEADEILGLPINLRKNVFEKMLHSLLAGTKYSLPRQETQRTASSDHISIDTSINDEQQLQVISNKTKAAENTKRTFSFNSTQKKSNEIDQSSNIQSKSFLLPTVNELDNDVVIVKINAPTSISLTTAICHFLDKGIPSLTIYEEIRLVNGLINHQLSTLLTLTDAQLYVEQYVINIATINYNHRMLFVQNFKQTLMPINSDKIQLKKWQLATLLHAHMNLEQSFH